jgi:hypothetical protein
MRLTDVMWFSAECGEPSGLLLRMPELGDRSAFYFPPRRVRMDVGDLLNGHLPFFPWDRSDATLRLHYEHIRSTHPESLYLD